MRYIANALSLCNLTRNKITSRASKFRLTILMYVTTRCDTRDEFLFPWTSLFSPFKLMIGNKQRTFSCIIFSLFSLCMMKLDLFKNSLNNFKKTSGF